MYISNVNEFLESQGDSMELFLDELCNRLYEFDSTHENTLEWYLDKWEAYADQMSR